MNLNTLMWTFAAIMSTVMSITFIKQYADTTKLLWVGLSLLSYILLVLSFSFLFSSEDVAIVYPIVKASSIVIIVLLSVFFYNQKIDTQSALAILMILVAIFMLSSKLS